MILVLFFLSHLALSKNLSRNGIGLKVTKFGDTNKQTDISRLILKDLKTVFGLLQIFSKINTCAPFKA
jgi:hypothetical protein